MSLKLHVNINKKAGLPDYGSVGASCGLELELDQSLLTADPDGLQARIRQAYTACSQAVTEELARQTSGQSNGHQANGQASAVKPRRSNGRSATQSQVRAIDAIAQHNGVNLGALLQDRFHVGDASELSISDASALIDELKSAGNGTGGRR